jgi:alginate O-acetyltransferase complex protein AlgI
VLFNSLTFVVFYVAVFAAYWALRARLAQNVLLLAASWIFYGAWSYKFLLLLIGSSTLDYFLGMLIERAASERRRKVLLSISVGSSLLFLATFKYLGFFVTELAGLLEQLGFRPSIYVLQIVLPVGISFYTFQTIGYVVDVYRRKVPAARSFIDYALYVAFFPQLVAGPIERADRLIPQFQRPRIWNGAAFESGLQLAFWGLFKKVVIADQLAPYVDVVYADPSRYSGAVLSTATVFFAFQIYCDFSGYTDTARGVARMLGFDLMRNFDFPYVSRTPVEFWQRWHISLSKWFQDYLYFPLAIRYMRKGGWGSKYKAHIVAMTLIGIWHGANWTFLIFGLYWGVAIALYLAIQEWRTTRYVPKPPSHSTVRAALGGALSVVGMFALVCVGWIFFRAASIADAGYVLTHLVSVEGMSTLGRPELLDVAILWGMIVSLIAAEWLYRHAALVRESVSGARLPAVVGRYALIVAILISASIGNDDAARPFIYFQF